VLQLRSSRNFFLFFLAGLLSALFVEINGVALFPRAFAEGTRLWEQSKFDDLEKGTATGTAICSDGGLELAPTFKSLYATPSTYIWAVAADNSGNVFIAAGAPARVYRITPEGKTTIIFEPKELQVQALRIGPRGVIYAATAPDGKVYRLEHSAGAEATASNAAAKRGTSKDADKSEESVKPGVDPSWSSTVYFEPDTKYIWDLALDKSGDLFVATGDRGEIYRVTPKGEHSLFFKSDETHIRVLAIDAQGNLIAGSDGSGLIYRISQSGQGFVLYSAPKKEITALALDADGNIYAAAVGEKRTGTAGTSSAGATLMTFPPSTPPAGGAPQVPSMTMTATPNTSITANPFPFPAGGASSGSDIYRLAPDGSPTRIWSSHEDIVYALAFDSQGRLIAGTGNRGHIFAVTGVDEFLDLLKAPASQVTALTRSPSGGLYAATSNLGKVFELGPGPEPEGTYESDVFDAKIFSQWGRVEFRGTGDIDLYARSGNVDNPDRNWSAWKKIDLAKDAETGIPAARYAQWKAVLHSGNSKSRVDSVALNYLPKNVAPEIEDVTVQPGVRYQSLPKTTGTGVGADISGAGIRNFDIPPPSSHDPSSIGVKWSAHDDNDDQLVYSIYYRGDDESRWLLLKDNLTDKAYSFDASLLPDGGYTLKVTASDAPSHSPDEALTASKESRRFEVDTTPPRIESLEASVVNGEIRVVFRAVDSFSPIKRAEFSIDAGDWKYVDPVGQLSDSKTENYDFKATPEPYKPGAVAADHVVVVRVYDRYDNMDSAKAVVRAK
jgi:WD40 repeat protein